MSYMDPYFDIGWYNDETGEWDKAKPDLPAFMKEPDDASDE